MQFKGVKKFILTKLKNELPGHLAYHNLDHTMDVFDSAKVIAEAEGISDREQKLLLTAALFHDAGFLRMRVGHENESCNIARAYLPDYNYTEQEIDLICAMIMATKLPQSAQTHLEKILCDADLDYLGRNDFFTLSAKLFAEMRSEKLVKDEEEWDKEQIRFMEAHYYYTGTSQKLRRLQKEEYVKFVRSKITMQIF
jgi:predicted HD phosphohydrolase